MLCSESSKLSCQTLFWLLAPSLASFLPLFLFFTVWQPHWSCWNSNQAKFTLASDHFFLSGMPSPWYALLFHVGLLRKPILDYSLIKKKKQTHPSLYLWFLLDLSSHFLLLFEIALCTYLMSGSPVGCELYECMPVLFTAVSCVYNFVKHVTSS